MKRLIMLSIGCSLLWGCSGDKSTTVAVEHIDYSQLKATNQSDSHLSIPSASATEAHVKNGLRLQLSQNNRYTTTLDNTGPVAAPSTGTGGSASTFSDTNVHIAGVDEADIAKYDGQHWFWAASNQQGMRIFNVGADSTSAALLSEQPALPSNIYTQGLYLLQDQGKTQYAISLNNEYGNIGPVWLPAINVGIASPAVSPTAALSIALPTYYRPQNGKLIIAWSDVSTPAKPSVVQQLTLQGRLMDSRKIGDILYVFTRFDPWLDELKPAPLNSAQQDSNESILQKTPLADLMPKYHFDQQADKPLTTNCLLPSDVASDVDSHQGFPSLVHITAVNLKTKTLLGSTCINAPMQNFTMNEQHAFLIANAPSLNGGSKTLIHQFTLGENGATYSATGSVKGSINGDLSFWLNEKDGFVRVLSSDFINQNYEHKITVLKEQKGALNSVSELPNGQHPEKIGKPGEQIYGARFVGARAYVVTFRRTDPLYVVDLKTPTDPYIAGELQVPGFATYLHPVGDNYLFSLGQSADESGRVNGIKTELIDVSNPAKPSSIRSLFFGSNAANAEALYDLHAVAVLPQANGDMRFAFSINNYDTNYQWLYTGMHLFSVEGVAQNKADLVLAGVVTTESRSEQQTFPRYYGNGRSLLNGDSVYFGTNGIIWASTWNNPKHVTGPIPTPKSEPIPEPIPEPIACTTDFRSGLEIHVFTATGDACAAQVTIEDGTFKEQPKGYYPSELRTECVFSGAGERAGAYLVTATLKGFAAQSFKAEVGKDSCHVITQKMDVKF